MTAYTATKCRNVGPTDYDAQVLSQLDLQLPTPADAGVLGWGLLLSQFFQCLLQG
jgi:hypothetical protein